MLIVVLVAVVIGAAAYFGSTSGGTSAGSTSADSTGGATSTGDASPGSTASATSTGDASPGSTASAASTVRPPGGGSTGGGTSTGGTSGGGGSGGAGLPGGSASGCLADLAKCGLPNAGNTGVPAGTALSVISGDYTITTDGAVISGKEFHGCVDVQAANVTIKNSRFFSSGCAIRNHSTGLTISDVEISCDNDPHLTGVGDANFTVIRANIHNCENGFDIRANVTVRDSYIHDLYYGDGAHTDGAQLNQGASNITLTHNTIISPNPGGTSAIGIWNEVDPQASNVLVSGNLLAGGAYTLYCPRRNSTNVQIVNNRFSSGEYGSTDSCTSGHVAAFTGNVTDSTHAPLGG